MRVCIERRPYEIKLHCIYFIYTFFVFSLQLRKRSITKKSVDKFLGKYVSEDYYQRSDGYDWINILITKKDDNAVYISIKSRSDKKKPTCTFDGEGIIVESNTLKSIFNEKVILFDLEDGILKVFMEKEKDGDLLYFFCSGGATLEGSYKKTAEK
ncbi:hypothetical protein [Psychrilyobacter atlanticus]|uniref:hypothetical protein n=1 Tax=Psychrilyobacter atlanticus TaxID=271091 RepID=UPI00041B60A8|nr:hypothetical protein [Psychrilyobacter atlanticus]